MDAIRRRDSIDGQESGLTSLEAKVSGEAIVASKEPARETAFTLVEMMVVIVIIGLLATLVVPNVMGNLLRANRVKAKADITEIVAALKEYAINNGGTFPDSLEPLVAPDKNGVSYLDNAHVPTDPWHRAYLYDPPGPGRPQPRVYSYGRDGQAGGEGEDRDIDSSTMNEEDGGARS